MRSALVAVLAAVLLASVAPAGPVGAQESDGTRRVVDDELLGRLADAGVLDQWFETSPHGSHASSMQVIGDEETDAARGLVMHLAEALASRRHDEVALLEAIEEADGVVATLDRLARTLRERAISQDDEWSPAEVALVRKVLKKARAGVDHESLEQAVSAIDRLSRDLGDHVVARRGDGAAKTAAQGPISLILDQLEALEVDLDELRAQAEATTLDEQLLAAQIVAAMVELHDRRANARTPLEGLPLVTLDAYLRAAEHGIAGCGVDWTLLGDAVVGPNGAVGPEPIFGPLLDGGATELEAAEAVLAAEEETARLAAEAAAEAERLAEEKAARDRLLYGDVLPPEHEDPSAGDSDDETAARLRLLYGEHAIPDDGAQIEDDDSADDEAETDDELDPADFDNGFAVIVDTDGGHLDGNPRWDRAVGPMQFLPETWSLFERDGNGDGVMDPHNLYDAAAGAAAYLCHLERRSGPSPWRYVLGYNNSDTYVAAVMDVADELAFYDIGS